MKLLATLTILALSATAHASGSGKPGKKTKVVVDKLVGGKVVKRTVVIGNLGRRPRQKLTTERQLAAMRKGWSVSEEAAEMPDDLTLGGRLQETDFRQQRGGRGQHLITLRRPGAEHLSGEAETRVYAGGKVKRIKKLASVRGGSAELPGPSAPRGTGRPVVTLIGSGQILSATGWGMAGEMALHYEPAENPLAVILDAGGSLWSIGRDGLGDALATGRGGSGDATFRVDGERFEIRLTGIGRNEQGATFRQTAVLRLPRAQVASFLRRSYESVPRGAEAAHIDFDRGIRGLLGE